ncbi:ABC transporter ATP-binding protein [Ruegeria marisrubri]|uniref:ABC transporter ATP-binding protein n=1 Tax=Ruegeria marisrubri TaxID=1685379 RepID=A0A0X3TL56_9RHOB|nr:ABC transporter ATP-binding protein [Ruegeria marisrubri]KUJ76495.1 ABC transporter ATP-binding protein [Ruegeria marisrubri]
MPIAHLLEHFDADPRGGVTVHPMSEEALEEERLAAFERGYAAGWEDALSAQQVSRNRIEASLAETLETLSFTYHEALHRMTLSLEPLFHSLVKIALPQMLEQGFGQQIVTQLKEMAGDQMAQPVELVVPPGVGGELQPLLEREFSMPVQLIEDAALLPGQAGLRVGTAECEVDCRALLAAIDEAFDAFLYQAKEGALHE